MSKQTRPLRRRIAGAATVSVAAVVMLAGLASATPELALSDHGGARRLDGDQSKTIAQAIDRGRARNVILLIGDGMGDSEITSARNYAYGAAGRFPGIDALPLTGQYTTYSVRKGTDDPDYVPDSAATGSAWATGTKTYDNAISVDTDGVPQRTLLELAKARGLRTGDVTTSELQDATPAVQVSHVTARSCYGPTVTSTTCPTNALENGGLGSITEQLIRTRADVTLGGGAATFAETAKAGPYRGRTLLDQADDLGYRIVNTKADLAAVRSATQDEPLLGLFAASNLPVRYTGPAASATGGTQPAVRCTDNPSRPATQPSLVDMTTKAIALLDRGDKGFFLQVEGASIDKRDHAADACGQIGETVDLDEAVQAALAFAKKDGNTSVFVTADHAHTSQIVEAGSTTPGSTVTLLTADDQPMPINYATAAVTGSPQHTGPQLRIAGYGPRAANIVGLTDQTDLFFTIADALRLPQTDEELSRNGRIQLSPRTVTAGAGVVINGSAFYGDETVTITLRRGGSTVPLPAAAVAQGTFTVNTTAPTGRGSWTVRAVGDQSGRTVSQRLIVR